MNIDSGVGVLGLVVVIAAALGLAWPVFKSKSANATIDLLHSELAIRDEAMAAQATRHAQDKAELKGEIASLRVQYARAIAREVAKEVGPILVEYLDAHKGRA